jgi:hypothetical protein
VLIADFAPDFWVHAVRFTVVPDAPAFHIGSIWNGTTFVHAADVQMTLLTTDGGTRQTGIDVALTDDAGTVTRSRATRSSSTARSSTAARGSRTR